MINTLKNEGLGTSRTRAGRVPYHFLNIYFERLPVAIIDIEQKYLKNHDCCM